jgi:hypothetical protein
MILVVRHPSLDPSRIIQPGALPSWLAAIASLVDLRSDVEPGHMKLFADEKNYKPLRDALTAHLPGCRILRVVRAGTSPSLTALDTVRQTAARRAA